MMPYSEDEDGVPCKTPSPRSSASQAPPNPRHNADEPPPRINLYTSMPSQAPRISRPLGWFRKDPEHKRGRSESAKFDIGPAQGVFDTPNVRERVRRWQQSGGGVVLPGDLVEVPPITPATPTPGSRRGVLGPPLGPPIDMSVNGIASQMKNMSTPLTPPRMPALRDEWETASESEKQAERLRTRSKDRERKLRRGRRDSDAGTPVGSGMESAGERLPKIQTHSPSCYEEDGIRIVPMKPKHRTSGSRRKKRESIREMLRDETDDGGVALGLGGGVKGGGRQAHQSTHLEQSAAETASELKTLVSEQPPKPVWEGDGIRVIPIRKKKSKIKPEQSVGFDVEVEFLSPGPELEPEPSESSRVKVRAWEHEDGIRTYATKPSTPVKFSDRKKSVRQSAKSVRSRREQFEANQRKAITEDKVFAHMIRDQDDGNEGGDEEDDYPMAVSKDVKAPTRDFERAAIEPVRHGIDNVRSRRTTAAPIEDDGIRVRPMKMKHKKSSEKSRFDDSAAEGSSGSRTAIAPILTPPPMLTESAPATPTGARPHREPAPFVIPDEPILLQTQDGQPVLVSRSASKKIKRQSSKKKPELSGDVPARQPSQRRQRRNYSPSRDREERRAERRRLREQIKEDSAKFQTMATRARSASPAPPRPGTERPDKERSAKERVEREMLVVQEIISESPPPVKPEPVIQEQPQVKQSPPPREEPTIKRKHTVKEKKPPARESLMKELLFPTIRSATKEKPPTKESPREYLKPVVKEVTREHTAARERPLARESLVRELLFPSPRPAPKVSKETVREPPKPPQKKSSKELYKLASIESLEPLEKEEFKEIPESSREPRERRRSMYESPYSASDGLRARRERALRSRSVAPASRESLPHSEDRGQDSHTKTSSPPPVTKGLARQRSRSTPPDSRSAPLVRARKASPPPVDTHRTSARRKGKEKDRSIIRKLPSAKDIIKAVKEEFTGKSVRSALADGGYTSSETEFSTDSSSDDSEEGTGEEEGRAPEEPVVEAKAKKTVRIQEQKSEDDEDDESTTSETSSSDSETESEASDTPELATVPVSTAVARPEPVLLESIIAPAPEPQLEPLASSKSEPLAVATEPLKAAITPEPIVAALPESIFGLDPEAAVIEPKAVVPESKAVPEQKAATPEPKAVVPEPRAATPELKAVVFESGSDEDEDSDDDSSSESSSEEEYEEAKSELPPPPSAGQEPAIAAPAVETPSLPEKEPIHPIPVAKSPTPPSTEPEIAIAPLKTLLKEETMEKAVPKDEPVEKAPPEKTPLEKAIITPPAAKTPPPKELVAAVEALESPKGPIVKPLSTKKEITVAVPAVTSPPPRVETPPPKKDATATPTVKSPRAMGSVEEPPKRSVRDLVKQLECRPDKAAKAPPPEPLRELLKEVPRELDIEPAKVGAVDAAKELAKELHVMGNASDAAKNELGAVEKGPVGPTLELAEMPFEPAEEKPKAAAPDLAVESPVEVAPLVPKPPPPSEPVQDSVKVSPQLTLDIDLGIPGVAPLQWPAGSDSGPLTSPLSPLPKRSMRAKPTPPRPKSVHSIISSDGFLTPLGSECGECDDCTSPIRSVSDASTVKPLRFTKVSKPQMIDVPKSASSATKTEPRPVDNSADWFNPEVSVKETSLKRKYTKHADLISILSAPKTKSVRSEERSRRSKTRKHVDTMTVDDLLREFAEEEVKYMRELRALVEDVVPILFQTVLVRADNDLRRSSSISSTGTSGTASSRSSRTGFSSNPTRPIVDMGISLERLRTLHERIPCHDADHLLAWAGDARRVYEEYLSVWRMGFQDVVVNMTPGPDEEEYERTAKAAIRKCPADVKGVQGGTRFEGDPTTWDMPPPPTMEEEIKDERVDVAFLLKRPLVRLKLLAKLFKRIDYINTSPLAASHSASFHALVTMARRKISEEKARIEDEAAASLDSSRAFDIHTLQPRRDVCLEQNRRVKARDSFTMRLYHSSEELIERSIELILRDPSPRSRYSEGEILFVELGENATKWLLFPPVPLSSISARTGDAAGEIVVMVCGADSDLQEWREIMALASSTAAGFEWVQMMGLVPIPPEGPFSREPIQPAFLETVIEESVVSRLYPPVQPRKRQTRYAPAQPTQPPKLNVFNFLEPDTETPAEPVTVQQHAESVAEFDENSEPELKAKPEPEPERQAPLVIDCPDWLPSDFSLTFLHRPDSYQLMGGEFVVPKFQFRAEPQSNTVKDAARTPSLHTLSDISRSDSPSPSTKSASSIQRSRRASHPHSRNKSISGKKEKATEEEARQHNLSRTRSVHHLDEEGIPPAPDARSPVNPMDNIPKLSPQGVTHSGSESEGDAPPPVPPHRTPTNASRGKPAPIVTSPRSGKAGYGGRRRTSSPLKHEYDPSSASNSEAEHAEPRHSEDTEEYTSSSASSSDEGESDDAVSLCSEEEDGEYPPPMISIPRRLSRQPSGQVSVSRQRATPNAVQDIAGADVSGISTPVGPRATTPPRPQHAPPPIPQIGSKFRAYLFTWATNQWQKMVPDECKVVITPGRLEAFRFVGSPGSPMSPSGVSLEPSVFACDLNATLPVRHGTAVDISVRTPGKKGANILLRSRSPHECEMLFNAINTHRIMPQDYQFPLTSTVSSLALSSDMGGTSEASAVVVGSIKRGFGGWSRSKSYRAGGASNPSLVSSPSEASISSAFSRFRPGKVFKSSPLGSVASSSSSMGDSSRGATPVGLPNVPGVEHSVVMMSPMKIRLHLRVTSQKWRNLGNSRLNVFKPLEGQRGLGIKEDDKRVVITNKKGDKVHLDVVLGESAFERVARTGIAISILVGEGEEDGTGKPGNSGGIGAKYTVYMMQMKGEAEAAYSFSVLGKLRY